MSLLPCPFCGNRPKARVTVEQSRFTELTRHRGQVECVCGALMVGRMFADKDSRASANSAAARADAIKPWNRRAPCLTCHGAGRRR